MQPRLALPDSSWKQPLTLPPDGQPQLWLVRTGMFRGAVARMAESVLNGAERERASAFMKDDDRENYLAAHLALRLLLSAYLHMPPARVPLDRLPCPSCAQQHGRPVVIDSPVQFSLSHSRGLCLLAFASTTVGVDVVAIPTLATVEEVTSALHTREAAELREREPADRPAAFALVWARKEAYLKGLGTGLGRDLSIDYLGTSAESVPEVPGWMIKDVTVDDGYAAAVALQAERP
jgi:4'-phosphopantetheinyl transferase